MLKKGFGVLDQRAEEGRPLIRSEFQTRERVSHRDRPCVLAAAGGGEPVCFRHRAAKATLLCCPSRGENINEGALGSCVTLRGCC